MISQGNGFNIDHNYLVSYSIYHSNKYMKVANRDLIWSVIDSHGITVNNKIGFR